MAAISTRNAWAVGSTGSGKTLIVRWNGKVWKRGQPHSRRRRNPDGVAIASADSAWAVGYTGTGARPSGFKTLILRWNGTTWTRVPSPTPGGGAALAGVAATNARNAWAVGAAAATTFPRP